MLKFRTMHVPPWSGQQQIWAQINDPRVTPIGKLLRTYRLDELPQLVNVLRGEMNVVACGPSNPVSSPGRGWKSTT